MSYSFMLFTSMNGTRFDLQGDGTIAWRIRPASSNNPSARPVVHVAKDDRQCKVDGAAKEQEEVPS